MSDPSNQNPALNEESEAAENSSDSTNGATGKAQRVQDVVVTSPIEIGLEEEEDEKMELFVDDDVLDPEDIVELEELSSLDEEESLASSDGDASSDAPEQKLQDEEEEEEQEDIFKTLEVPAFRLPQEDEEEEPSSQDIQETQSEEDASPAPKAVAGDEVSFRRGELLPDVIYDEPLATSLDWKDGLPESVLEARSEHPTEEEPALSEEDLEIEVMDDPLDIAPGEAVTPPPVFDNRGPDSAPSLPPPPQIGSGDEASPVSPPSSPSSPSYKSEQPQTAQVSTDPQPASGSNLPPGLGAGRHSQASGPATPPLPQSSPRQQPPPQGQQQQQQQADAEGDDELSGLVQELIGESEEEPPAPAEPPAEVEKPWFETIFTEEYFRTLPLGFHKQTVREAKFIDETLNVGDGGQILDLCCGFGRHTLEMAKRGYDMSGLDLSLPLLQKALNEAQRRNLSIRFIHGDIRELNFNEEFDAIFNFHTSFGYFDDQTNFNIVERVFRALKPGGRFLLEMLNRDYAIRELPKRTWWEGPDCLFLEEIAFNYDNSVLHTKRSFIYEDGRSPWEQNVYIRLYSLHEMRSLLRAAGFDVVSVSGDIATAGYFMGPNSKHIIALAERPL